MGKDLFLGAIKRGEERSKTKWPSSPFLSSASLIAATEAIKENDEKGGRGTISSSVVPIKETKKEKGATSSSIAVIKEEALLSTSLIAMTAIAEIWHTKPWTKERRQ